jgi:oligopeptide transport system substrate-binding protein
MNTQLATLSRLALIATLMVACGGAQTPSPQPPPPQAPTATPTVQPPTPAPSPSPNPSPIATLDPNQFPQLPTATLAPVSPAKIGEYRNPDYGIGFDYPVDWVATPETDTSQGGLVSLSGPDSVIAAVLFFTPWGDQGLESSAQAIVDSSFGQLQNRNTLSDEAITLADGSPAWQTVITAQFDNGVALKASLTTIVVGARTFSLMFYGPPSRYDRAQTDIDQIALSLHASGQNLFGLPRAESLVLAGGESSNPRDYDPATNGGGSDGLVFTGLVSFDLQANLVPELAESWTVTDGTVYTFFIRPNARFHNGRPVTAQDFVYSWERAADPATDSDTVLTYLGDIVGVKEMHAGQADHIAGLKVIDDLTLQVTIDAPKPYFLLKLTFPTGNVVDQFNIAEGSDWYRSPNGTGPYRLIRWEQQKVIIYERNDDYYLDPPQIRFIVMKLYAGDSLRLYESGEVDFTGVGRFDLARFQDPQNPTHGELHESVNLCTGYIGFDVSQPPFDDVNVRQAFTMAFDRQHYIETLYNGIGIPARGLFPPALPGYNLNLKSLPYDPEQARQLLAESRYGGPAGLPPIVFTTGGYGSYSGGSIGALAQMWQNNLGVTISVENLEPDLYYDEVRAGHHGQITSGGWCADYPDPENFADVLFHSGAANNTFNYSSPEVDSLLERARTETDVTIRLQLYQQVEQIIVNDAPALFTTHSQSFTLVKPYIKGYVDPPFGISLFRYLSLDSSRLP